MSSNRELDLLFLFLVKVVLLIPVGILLSSGSDNCSRGSGSPSEVLGIPQCRKICLYHLGGQARYTGGVVAEQQF